MRDYFFNRKSIYSGIKKTGLLFINSLRKRNILFYVFAILSTYFIASLGIDYIYLDFVIKNIPKSVLVSADILGFIIPVLLPIVFIIKGYRNKDKETLSLGWLFARVTFVAFSITTLIKIFTNRASPPYHGDILDISHIFDFGFFERNPIGGWPSSHTAVIFALATIVYLLFPKKKYTDLLMYFIAIFISIGVTFGFHWLSDFVAGVMIGIVVGKEAARLK